MDNDIALLELEKSAGAGYPPVSIWDKEITEGAQATILGWGNLSASGEEYPDKLQKVTVPVVSNSDCNIPYKNEITENLLCAGLKEGGKDSFKYTMKDITDTAQAEIKVNVVFDTKEAAKNCFIESVY